MEFIADFKGINNTYTQKINDSKYIEKIKAEEIKI